MINIAPLDYERYAVLVSPLLVQESPSSVKEAPPNKAEPTEPAKGSSNHREAVAGNEGYRFTQHLIGGDTIVGKGAMEPSFQEFTTSIYGFPQMPVDLWAKQYDKVNPGFMEVTRLYQILDKPTETHLRISG